MPIEIKTKFILERGHKIVCVETNEKYDSIRQADRITGIHNQSIIKCLQKKQKTAGGYHWEYIKEQN